MVSICFTKYTFLLATNVARNNHSNTPRQWQLMQTKKKTFFYWTLKSCRLWEWQLMWMELNTEDEMKKVLVSPEQFFLEVNIVFRILHFEKLFCLDCKYGKMLLLCCIVSMVLMIEFVDQTFAFPLLWLPAAVPTVHPISCQHTTAPWHRSCTLHSGE